MSIHLSAAHGDYAPVVLLPGDPLRAEWIARTLLDDVVAVNAIRGALGFTGTHRGQRVSVQTTGMGRPSLAIYVHELVMVYGVKRLIRIGTCGALPASVPLRHSVVAESGVMEQDFAATADVQTPDPVLLAAARRVAAGNDAVHFGPMLSSDRFYHPDGMARFDGPRDAGLLAVDMETSGLYADAAALGVQALSICTVVDSAATGTQIDPSERQAVFGPMVTLALEIAALTG